MKRYFFLSLAFLFLVILFLTISPSFTTKALAQQCYATGDRNRDRQSCPSGNVCDYYNSKCRDGICDSSCQPIPGSGQSCYLNNDRQSDLQSNCADGSVCKSDKKTKKTVNGSILYLGTCESTAPPQGNCTTNYGNPYGTCQSGFICKYNNADTDCTKKFGNPDVCTGSCQPDPNAGQGVRCESPNRNGIPIVLGNCTSEEFCDVSGDSNGKDSIGNYNGICKPKPVDNGICHRYYTSNSKGECGGDTYCDIGTADNCVTKDGQPYCEGVCKSQGTETADCTVRPTKDSTNGSCEVTLVCKYDPATCTKKFGNDDLCRGKCEKRAIDDAKDPPSPPPPPCAEKNDKGECKKFNTGLGLFSTNPGRFIASVFAILLAASGAIALILIMRAGYKIMTSQGKPESIQEGKDQLIAAIVGLLFLIFSLVFLEVIGVDILQIPGVKGNVPEGGQCDAGSNSQCAPGLTCESVGGTKNGICTDKFSLPGITPNPINISECSQQQFQLGSNGNCVEAIQRMLNVEPVDGVFGPITEDAVRKYQTDNGLIVDGTFNTCTWNAIMGDEIPNNCKR